MHLSKQIAFIAGLSVSFLCAALAQQQRGRIDVPIVIGGDKEFNACTGTGEVILLDSKGDAVGITAALRGAGGYGKTVLANALCHDPDIQDAYFDGILRVELGEQPDNLIGLVSDLIKMITGAGRRLQHDRCCSIEAQRDAWRPPLSARDR